MWLTSQIRTPSIRATVLIWQLGALLLLGSVAVSSAYIVAVRSFDELRKQELSQIADTVARHGIDNDDTNDEQPGDFLSQVWEADGRLSYASHEPAVARPQNTGHFNFVYGKQTWYGYAANYQGQTVLIARDSKLRGSLLAKVSLPLLAAVAILTLGLMALLALRVERALSPLEALRTLLAKRDASSLTKIELSNSPSELVPLIETLNTLLDRVNASVDGQRQFTADAAHELRTPITAVGLFAQLARKDAETGKNEALLPHIASIEACCHRASAMIDQLLTLARLDPENPPKLSLVALHDLVRQTVAEFSALADDANVDLGLVECVPCAVEGDLTEMRILIGNLIGNAISYTPSGGRVDVALTLSEGAPRLSIEDTGPGLPAAELDKVFGRFHRVAGQDTPGSGLGLAIVRRIAQRYALTVKLKNRPSGGLHASVQWSKDISST